MFRRIFIQDQDLRSGKTFYQAMRGNSMPVSHRESFFVTLSMFSDLKQFLQVQGVVDVPTLFEKTLNEKGTFANITML